MGEWERSPLKMSGAEFEVQEAMLALRRVIEGGAVRPATRAVLEGAIQALAEEQPESGLPRA